MGLDPTGKHIHSDVVACPSYDIMRGYGRQQGIFALFFSLPIYFRNPACEATGPQRVGFPAAAQGRRTWENHVAAWRSGFPRLPHALVQIPTLSPLLSSCSPSQQPKTSESPRSLCTLDAERSIEYKTTCVAPVVDDASVVKKSASPCVISWE